MLIDSSADTLLEQTSRSFFLTLKVLPKSIRKQVGLLYLLARVADTIADSKTGEVDLLLSALEAWDRVTSHDGEEMGDLSHLSSLQTNPSEKELLENVDIPLNAFNSISENDRIHMRRCLKIIISGQTLDLQRFGPANDSDKISSLENEKELDDYAYRVAGCVGEFWTTMTLAHIVSVDGPTSEIMFEHGIRFGKALQMINILRDIPEDLSFGRCYIPKPLLEDVNLEPSQLLDASNYEKFSPVYQSLLDITQGHIDAAEQYILMLPKRQIRLKIACLLPILIGQQTVNLLRTNNVLDSNEPVKVPRKTVKRLMTSAIIGSITPGGTRRLLKKNRKK
ncbi:MAG: farnesyl-diphosphate farnesyltransferase [Euryarchaeota archaeon]|nr:farnesyl-diphosphate farnesyltransferase [Euryarchaeota archaeon]|tara:strand:- start:1943 stop:2953 length:1011 start_codon:yes stop_codon:yes gene_type:complete